MTKRPRPLTSGPGDVPDLRINGPGDLVQAVPYLLGFHPRDSLVLIGLDGRRLVVTARVDLVDLAEPDLLGQLVGALTDGGARTLVGVVYDSEPALRPPLELPWSGLVRELVEETERLGGELGDVLRVNGERWWSYACDGEECCPPEGNAIPTAPSAFVAGATYAGVVALPDRAALAATLAPLPESARSALAPRLAAAEAASAAAAALGRRPAEWRAVRQELVELARSADRAGAAPLLDDARVARFGCALTAVPVRDALWSAIEAERVDGRAVWRELARRLPAPYDVAPLFLFGWASWRAGNGALAGVAVDRALAGDPGCGAADLLRAVLDRGLNPRCTPRLTRAGMLAARGDEPAA